MSGLEPIVLGLMAANTVAGMGQSYAEGKTQEAALKQKALDAEAAGQRERARASMDAEALEAEGKHKVASFQAATGGEAPVGVLAELKSNIDREKAYRSFQGEQAMADAKRQGRALRSQAKVAGNTTAGQLATLVGGLSDMAGTGYRMSNKGWKPFG